MRAALLKAFGSPLSVEEIDDPVLGTGEVIVDVVAAGVLPYAGEVISNARRYMIEPPIVLGTGAIGRVRAVGPDATKLQPGDWVSCDATVRSRDDALTPDITLQGLSARGEGGLKLQRFYHHGSWAQRMLVPTENAVPIGQITPEDAARWCAMSRLMVPYGGLLAADLRPGETVVVSGATGGFGSAGVAVALAMGAGRVVAPGRNGAMLEELARRFGSRVAIVALTGEEAADTAAMQATAAGPVDVVLDILPPSADMRASRAAIMTVREFGRVALMGGVGMLGGDDLALPYPWIMRNGITIRGQWMYSRTANASMVRLIRAGLIDLSAWTTTEFALDAVADAVQHAETDTRAFSLTVVRP